MASFVELLEKEHRTFNHDRHNDKVGVFDGNKLSGWTLGGREARPYENTWSQHWQQPVVVHPPGGHVIPTHIKDGVIAAPGTHHFPPATVTKKNKKKL